MLDLVHHEHWKIVKQYSGVNHNEALKFGSQEKSRFRIIRSLLMNSTCVCVYTNESVCAGMFTNVCKCQILISVVY